MHSYWMNINEALIYLKHAKQACTELTLWQISQTFHKNRRKKKVWTWGNEQLAVEELNLFAVLPDSKRIAET